MNRRKLKKFAAAALFVAFTVESTVSNDMMLAGAQMAAFRPLPSAMMLKASPLPVGALTIPTARPMEPAPRPSFIKRAYREELAALKTIWSFLAPMMRAPDFVLGAVPPMR